MERYCSWCEVKHEFCDCCHIGIGNRHEVASYSSPVGDYKLCDWCLRKLRERGCLEIHKLEKRSREVIVYLLPDGQVEEVDIGKVSGGFIAP